MLAYWEAVFGHLEQLVEVELPHTPLLALLGYVLPLSKGIRRFTAIALALAK